MGAVAVRRLSAEERARIAQAYGVRAVPAVATVVPRGVSGFTEDNPEVIGWRERGQRALKAARRVTPPYIVARRERVATAHARGLTVAQMVADLGENERILRDDLRVLNLVPHAPPRPAAQLAKRKRKRPNAGQAAQARSARAAALTDRLRAFAAQGMTQSEAAAAAGVSASTASLHAKKHGIVYARASRAGIDPNPARRARADARRDRVREMMLAGVPLPEIAVALGAVVQTVRKDVSALRAAGLLPPAAPRKLAAPVKAPKAAAPVRTPIAKILADVALAFGVTADDLCGRSTCRALFVPRQEAMRRCVDDAGWPLSAVGRALGGRDTSTVLHGVRVARARRAEVMSALCKVGGVRNEW